MSHLLNVLINICKKSPASFSRSISTSPKMQSSTRLIFKQLFDHESCTYTYLLGDVSAKECVLIDPVLEQVERDTKLINELGLKLKYAMNTHMHADHITGTGLLKKTLPGCKSLISKTSGATADVYVNHNDVVSFGDFSLFVKSTPGHTNGCVTYICDKESIAFTGDTLLIRGCGRTDFQEGDPNTLYDSVYREIFSLPGHYKLFPAHDYKGLPYTTVDEEKKYNPRLTKTREEFVNLMNNLNLPYPKKIDIAVPANRVCGIQDPL